MRTKFISVLLLASIGWFSDAVSAQAIPVTIEKNADGEWQLMRNGEPYYIK